MKYYLHLSVHYNLVNFSSLKYKDDIINYNCFRNVFCLNFFLKKSSKIIIALFISKIPYKSELIGKECSLVVQQEIEFREVSFISVPSVDFSDDR